VHCFNCGYQQASIEGICPECGQPASLGRERERAQLAFYETDGTWGMPILVRWLASLGGVVLASAIVVAWAGATIARIIN